MVDPSDGNDKLTERLLSSPTMLAAWQKLSNIEHAYAWHMLNHNWLLPPDVPREQVPHNPRLRIWDDAAGWTDQEPVTLTVFESL